MFLFNFVFGINTPWLAAFVIPAPDYEIRGQAPAGIQTPSLQAVSRELFNKEFWIPD